MVKTSITTSYADYNGKGYEIFKEKWLKCREVLEGEDLIKKRGDKYLPKSAYHKKGGKQGELDYESFKNRAVWYKYFNDAVRTMLGVMSKNPPDKEIPPSLQYIEKSATPYKDGLEGLKRRMTELILETGCAGLSCETNGDGNGTEDYPDFYFNLWQPESIKDKAFKRDAVTGETYARFVLLDETSDDEFDYVTKQRKRVEMWRLMALDKNGEYFTVRFPPELYCDIDFDQPVTAADANNPRDGEAYYPTYKGQRFHRVPFTFVNSTDLSGGHYQDPPLYDIVGLVLALYRGEADYRQTLHFMGSGFFKATKCDDSDKNMKELALGPGGLAKLYGETDINVVSTNGNAADQKAALDDLHEQCQRKILTLLNVGANQSGLALEMIQGSKSALIEPVNQNIGKAIEQQLRYAAMWNGMSREDAFNKVKYSCARIEDTSLEVGQLISLWNAKKMQEFPITKEDFHKQVQKTGLTANDFEVNNDKLEIENAVAATANGGVLPGEPLQKDGIHGAKESNR